MEQLSITCSYKDTLPLDSLVEFQGGLKTRNTADYDKIIASIKKYGFSFPFFVWQNEGKNNVLDGHGRLKALHIMQENGYEIPELPVTYVQANSKKEAKDLLLRLNSSYGRMTKKTVSEFIGEDLDLDFSNFELPAYNLDFSSLFIGQAEPVDDAYKLAIEKRDTVSPTTKATKPVIEMSLEDDISEQSENSTEIRQVAEPEQSFSKGGEVYYLGNHVLICADGKEDYDKLFSTLIDCEKNSKKCFCTVINPLCCDWIRKKWTEWAKANNVEVGSGALN